MTFVLLIIAVTLLMAMAIAQFVGVRLLARKVDVSSALAERDRLDERPLPKTAVLLSLRGADPDLAIGLEALGRQTHPDYQVVVVIDSADDPSWVPVREALSRLPAGRIRVEVLRERRANCGLKCSALSQAYRSLDPSVRAIALVDADIVVHPEWLVRLVGPLRNESVGVVSGAQWFEPHDHDSGTWIRSIWNAGASVPTILLGHPWAGSCAMRRDDIERTGLIDRWERSIIDDGPIAQVAAEMGREVRFVPQTWMINREHCSRRFVGTYLKRMLTWSRHYESTYPLTVGHAVATVAIWGVAWAGLFQGLVLADPWRIRIGLTGGVAFWIAAVWGYRSVRRIAAGVAAATGEPLPRRGWADLLRVIWLVPATYLIYAWASVAALFVRRIQWRGVEYVLDRDSVRLTHYEPYRVAGTSTRSSVGTPQLAPVHDPSRGVGRIVVGLGIALQLSLLGSAAWTPRFAAVITPHRIAVSTTVGGRERIEPAESADRGAAEEAGDTVAAGAASSVGESTATGNVARLVVMGESFVGEPERAIGWERIDALAARIDAYLGSIADVEGRLIKQERIAGRLEAPTEIAFRQLSRPLAIRLLWTDTARGREVLFRTEPDGTETMLARQETVLGALVPTVSLSKDHAFTRSVSAHPVDELSIDYLRRQLKRYLNQAKRNPASIVELTDAADLEGVRCYRLSIVHPERGELAPTGYHRVEMFFDAETLFPLRWEKYHWPGWQGAEEYDAANPSVIPPLLEHFRVLEHHVNRGLTIDDFRTDHPEYGFGKAPIVPLE